jgi:hypothetical protein
MVEAPFRKKSKFGTEWYGWNPLLKFGVNDTYIFFLLENTYNGQLVHGSFATIRTAT